MRGRRFVRAAVLLGALALCIAPPAGAQTFNEYLIDNYAGPPEGVVLAAGAEINTPNGLVIATDGTLYVTDAGNDRVLKVTPAGVVSRVAGTGAEGRGADGVPATSSQIKLPHRPGPGSCREPPVHCRWEQQSCPQGRSPHRDYHHRSGDGDERLQRRRRGGHGGPIQIPPRPSLESARDDPVCGRLH